MNRTTEIAGYVTHIGALVCVACAEKAGPVYVGRFSGTVYVDTSPHNEEACDFCGKKLTDRSVGGAP